MNNVDDERMSMSSDSWQQIEEISDIDLIDEMIVNASLSCFLRLGYLKPFLAGSKKTRQGLGCRVGALCISRC